MIAVFFGEDFFEIEKEIKKISSDSEFSSFEVSDFQMACSVLSSQAFFDPKRTIVLNNFLGQGEEKSLGSLLKAIENLDQKTNVIFIEKGKPKKSKVLDFIQKNGTIKEFLGQKGTSLVSFIKEKVKEEGGEIAPLAAERLAGFVGPDKWQLSEEIKKLVLYKKTEGEVQQIETGDVDLLVNANFESNIFSLMDAFAAKNSRRASELLNSFLDNGENEIYILTMIEKQFRNIAMAKFEEGVNQDKLAKKAKLHPFVAKKSIEQARNFEKSEIVEIYLRLMEADLKLKSGYDPKQILLRLAL